MARILVVDDSKLFLISLKSILEGAAHEVTTAASGADALEWLRQRPFDLVITDIYMPPPDGLELMQAVRLMKLAVPFIVISSRPSPLNMFIAARGLGAHLSLQKPFSDGQLTDAVEAVLDGSSASRAPILK